VQLGRELGFWTSAVPSCTSISGLSDTVSAMEDYRKLEVSRGTPELNSSISVVYNAIGESRQE